MEETWELAVVMSALETLFEFAGKIVSKLDPWRLVLLILLLISPFFLSLLFFEDVRAAFFGSPDTLPTTLEFFTAITAIIASIGSLFGFVGLQKLVQRGVLSSSESAERQVLEDISSIRRQIEKEKNEEIRSQLKNQETALRKELTEFNLEGLREKSGELSSDWREAILLSRSRLIEEAKRLRSRSASNLSLGMTISGIAILILIYLIFIFDDKTNPQNWFEFLTVYGPRLALLIIIQILGTFFLRMYVANEKDIRRNKNEITNLEIKLAAGMLAEGSKATLNKLAEKLVSEERNFVMDKKEKSVLSDANPELTGVISSIQKLIKEVKS